MEIVEVAVCRIRVVKKKEHLLFYRELSIFFSGDRVVVDQNLKGKRLIKTQLLDG